MARLLQNLAQQLPHRRLVVHNKYLCHPLPPSFLPPGLRTRPHAFVRDRRDRGQADAEGRASPHFRLDLDRAAVPSDDAVGDGQAEAHPAHALRREERVEDLRTHLGRHPRARVAHGDEDRAAELFRREPQVAAPRHRVHGVEDHVDQDVAQLGGVAADERARVVAQREVDVHVRGLRRVLPARARDLAHVEEEPFDGDGLEVAVAPLAREVLYVADGLRAVLRGGEDDLQAAARLRVGGLRQHQLGARQYRGERVVDVVRDARGQHPQGRHLLDLRELFADALLLGDVARKLLDVALRLVGALL